MKPIFSRDQLKAAQRLHDHGETWDVIEARFGASIRECCAYQRQKYGTYNDPSRPPPTDCPVMLRIGNRIKKGTRLGWQASSPDDFVYRLDEGYCVEGRFEWTYP